MKIYKQSRMGEWVVTTTSAGSRSFSSSISHHPAWAGKLGDLPRGSTRTTSSREADHVHTRLLKWISHHTELYTIGYREGKKTCGTKSKKASPCSTGKCPAPRKTKKTKVKSKAKKVGKKRAPCATGACPPHSKPSAAETKAEYAKLDKLAGKAGRPSKRAADARWAALSAKAEAGEKISYADLKWAHNYRERHPQYAVVMGMANALREFKPRKRGRPSKA